MPGHIVRVFVSGKRGGEKRLQVVAVGTPELIRVLACGYHRTRGVGLQIVEEEINTGVDVLREAQRCGGRQALDYVGLPVLVVFEPSCRVLQQIPVGH